MNTQNPAGDALRDLAEIRGIMERSSRFLSLSGLSGVFAGIFALLGAGVAYFFLGYGELRYDSSFHRVGPGPHESVLLLILLDAILVLLLALGSSFFFSRRKARRAGQSLWNPAAGKVLYSLAVPLVTGGILCLVLYLQRDISLLASLTLVFYGLALVNASRYLVAEILYLGLSEIFLGILASMFIHYGLLFWTLGFGILHILYGVVMYLRYERTAGTSGQGA